MDKQNRKAIIAGNWKMNKTPTEAGFLLDDLIPQVEYANCEVVCCVPATDLAVAIAKCAGTNVHVGAQNVHFEKAGAYTGEISADMLADLGVEYVVVGHSERRQYFAETDETVNKRTRAALEKAAEYYEKGYISQEFSTMDSDMRNEDMFNGKCGIYFADVWGAYWPLLLHLDIDPNADWIPVNAPSAQFGDSKMARDAAQVQNILVATKDCEHPEALVKMTNLYHNLNNNPETMEFEEYNTVPEDNNQIFLCYPLLIYNPSFNYEGYVAITDAMESGNTDGLCSGYKLFYDQAMSYEESKDPAGWPPYRSYLKEGTAFEVIDTYLNNDRVVFNEYTAEDTEFMIENEPTVKRMYDEMAVQVITGQADISAFDEFVASWDELFGNTATEEVNQWFQDNGGVSIQSQMG